MVATHDHVYSLSLLALLIEHRFDFESSVMQNQSLKWDLGVGLCGEEACGWGSCLGLIKPHATHKSMAKLIMMIGKRT